jgi:diaminopimelate epimerase (EC 5.1.1.7)
MEFVKMHGLGNNYIIVNQLNQPGNVFGEEVYPELARKVSDVNFGIGSDGLILICPSQVADFRMRIFNKDGSEGQSCGNGLRCVAKLLYDQRFVENSSFSIETLGGVVTVEVETGPDRLVRMVNVNMGKPGLLKGRIPMAGDPFETAIDEPHLFDGKEYRLTCLFMGNPHAILFVEDVHAFPLEEIGPVIEHSPLFPERVNVGIAQVKDKSGNELYYRVWERGSGITMACGTGACASAVAAVLNRLLDPEKPITVHLPGGDLFIRFDAEGNVWKRGEATYICCGEYFFE